MPQFKKEAVLNKIKCMIEVRKKNKTIHYGLDFYSKL